VLGPWYPRRVRRLHLFEFGDQQWLPQLLRDAETAYLTAAYRVWPELSRKWAEKISTVLGPSGVVEIVDLCSGSGGPIPQIIEALRKRNYDVHASLTDLYPSPNSGLDPRITWRLEPVDAMHVPSTLTGMRTMFSAFHHFRPDAARAILKDAFDSRRAICIFESGSGTLLGMAAMLGVPLAVMALMPLARPFRWAYLLFTYLVPLAPFIIFWDGMVSMLRIYSPDQMQSLMAGLKAPDYLWELGQIKVRGIPDSLPYLIGRPIP
jgi:hypothetical protein